MKTMTCKQLGGACNIEFRAETFEEMAELSQQHGMEMFQKQDEAHIEAMQAMSELMNDPEGLQQWMDGKRADFEALPHS
ncbi:MAG: DUF1059 domain-containing protein [Balneola sp.]|nr:MAG: DUF1059 domain-containing protein [Balneola sp.]